MTRPDILRAWLAAYRLRQDSAVRGLARANREQNENFRRLWSRIYGECHEVLLDLQRRTGGGQS